MHTFLYLGRDLNLREFGSYKQMRTYELYRPKLRRVPPLNSAFAPGDKKVKQWLICGQCILWVDYKG